MKKEEILQKVGKAHVGEMEKQKINKSSWIALIVTVIVAIALMIVEGCLGHYEAIYAIAFICYTWASVFYFCQYFIAKRPKGVLIGAVLDAIGAIIMITFYILTCLGVI